MATRLLLAACAASGLALASAPPAHAIGCVTGGLAGAVAGHMAHHGVLGAVGGCVAGHVAHKHQQRALQSRDERGGTYQTPSRDERNGY